jgi:hypothetical protein
VFLELDDARLDIPSKTREVALVVTVGGDARELQGTVVLIFLRGIISV